MSRKTRKLIWSAPLVAVLAVAGALAMFVMLAPDGALAHSIGDASVPHLPPGPATGIDVSTPSAEEGGRTSLRVTWNAPTGGDIATMYRVDMSTNGRIWHNVIGGEASSDTLADSVARDACTEDDERNRCYTVMGLMPGTEYRFRVFAMNDLGTGPISADETIGTGETLPVDPPTMATMLEATDYFADQIVLTWDTPTDTGGADLKWYCVVIASSPDGNFIDPTSENLTDCRDAANATMTAPSLASLLELEVDGNAAAAYFSQMVAIPATMARTDANDDPVEDSDGNPILDPVVTWTHEELGEPDLISLRYRLYAVTEDASEARRISRAASNTATGRTVSGPKESPARVKKPEAPRNLRAVAYGGTLNDGNSPTTPDDNSDDTLTIPALNFYWNAPGNFPAGTEKDPRTWTMGVERLVPDPDDEKKSIWVSVPGSPPTVDPDTANATPQFAVNMAVAADLEVDTPVFGSPTLTGTTPSSGAYRIRFVNPGADDDEDTPLHQNTMPNDDVVGAWARINLSMPLNAGDHISTGTLGDSTLPIISKEAGNGTHDDADEVEGLRFERHPTDPKNQIVLRWMRDVNSNSVEAKQRPNGYVVDRSDDGGMTWQPMARATSPNDLGTDTVYRDRHMITPGQRYTYRVFPVVITSGNFQDDFGLPGQIAASSEQADIPDAITGVKVDADGQRALKVSWNLLPDSKAGGHLVMGYLVQVANDVDNDLLLDEDATWEEDLNIQDDVDTDNVDEGRPYTAGKDVNMYTYRPTTDADGDPTLTPGSVRWFRVIAITAENDGDAGTGGNQVEVEDGTLRDNESGRPQQSADEANPTEEDEEKADPKRGKTDGVADPSVETDAAPPEVALDLTAEAASDTNALGDGARGVFLTWNEAKMADTETGTYRIERKRMDTGVDALDNDTWQFVGRANGDTSFTDRTPLRDDGETRMYRVGSEATGQPDAVFTDPAVDYALHPDMHMPSMPQMVTAAADSDTAITVSWAIPADNGGSDITGFTVRWKQSDATSYAAAAMATADATASSHMVTGLMAGTSYTFQVRATNAEGMGAWSMYASAMTRAAVPSMPTGVTATAMSDTHITVAWTVPSDNGGSAITGYEIEYTPAGGTAMTYSCTCSDGDGNLNAAGGVTLMPATEYTIRVRAINAAGAGAWSTSETATTEVAAATELTAPGITMVTVSGSTVTIEWTDGANADSHAVGLVNKDDYSVVAEDNAPTGNSAAFDNVPDGTYFAIVAAFQGFEYKVYLEEVTVPSN